MAITRTETTQADWQQGTLTNVLALATGDLELNKVGTRFPASNLFTNGRLTSNGSGWTATAATAWVNSSGQWPFIHTEQQWDGVYQNINISQTGWYVISYYVKHKTGILKIGSHTSAAENWIRIDGGPWREADVIDVPNDGAWHLIEMKVRYDTTGSKQVYLQPGRGVVGISEFYFQYALMEMASNQSNPSATLPDFSGFRISPALDLSPVGIAGPSSISWNATVPAGTSLIIETSIDGGQTWQQAINGGPIPSIPLGTDLTGKSLLIRQTLSTTDTNVTPTLKDLTVTIGSLQLAAATAQGIATGSIDMTWFGLATATAQSFSDVDVDVDLIATAQADMSSTTLMEWNEHIQAVSATAMAGATMAATSIRLLIETLVINAVIQPGDIVEIDTARMTVKINGVNALQYLEGDFFTLLPGTNHLEYQDSEQSRDVQIITRHRPRWL